MRTEPILAVPISRMRWATSHLIFAVGGPAFVLTVSGFAIGISYGLAGGNHGHDLMTMVATAIRTLPAVWVIGGVAMLLFGIAPQRANLASWAVLAACLALELGWEMRQVSQSIFDLSLFAYVHWAAGEISLPSVAGLTIVAAILTTAGLAALNRRDIG